MLSQPPKHYILPFTPKASRDPFSQEVEAAAIYAVAELERSKGGGLVVKQPRENLLFITKTGYPLWLFPKTDAAYIFDGLNHANNKISYAELPTAKTFQESLETNPKTRQDYMKFLRDHSTYFGQPKKEKEFMIHGLIADPEFKKDFTMYRREAAETAQPANLALLKPTLEESAVASMLGELDKLQSFLKEDAERLPECLRLINKLTSQYLTELDFAAQAVRDEANAKIRARQELVEPQIDKLNSEYKRKVANLSRSIDEEVETLTKQLTKAEKSIESNEEKISQYQREAQSQAEQKHLIYEKRWKEKVSDTKKEVGGLKKERNRLEKTIKNLRKQKTIEISNLAFKLEADIKVARQPIVDLEADRDAKMLVFKQETERLQRLEKPVVESLYVAIKQREAVNAKFEALGIKDQQLKSPALFYVPFYAVCFQKGLSRRYIFVPPSVTSGVGFSAKLKGAFGMSKIKEVFSPRFKSIAGLIANCQVLVKRDLSFESEIGELGERSNLLNVSGAVEGIAKGLVYLQHEGWLSDKEYQALNSSLTHP